MGKGHIFLDLVDVVVDRVEFEFDALIRLLQVRFVLDTILIIWVLFTFPV